MKHYTDISKYNSHKTESEKDKTRVFQVKGHKKERRPRSADRS